MSRVAASLSPNSRNSSASRTGLLAVGSAGSAGSRGHAQIPTSTGSPRYSPATTAAPAGIRLPVVAPSNSVVHVPSARRTPATYMTMAAPDGSTLTSAGRRSSSRQPYSATAAASTFVPSGPSSSSSTGVATSPRLIRRDVLGIPLTGMPSIERPASTPAYASCSAAASASTICTGTMPTPGPTRRAGGGRFCRAPLCSTSARANGPCDAGDQAAGVGRQVHLAGGRRLLPAVAAASLGLIVVFVEFGE